MGSLKKVFGAIWKLHRRKRLRWKVVKCVMVVIAHIKSCLVCYTHFQAVVCSSPKAVDIPRFESENWRCGAPFTTCPFHIKKAARLMCLARTCLFLRTKAIFHGSAASSGHRQKTVAGRMNLNEEMEKAVSKWRFVKGLGEAAFDFPVCIEAVDCSR